MKWGPPHVMPLAPRSTLSPRSLASLLACWLASVLPLRLVGVGEASFISLAAPCISDCAPRGRVSLWLACFYLCIPVGFALGFIYGSLMGSAAGWRLAFAFEALLMLPFVLFLLHRGAKRGGPRGCPSSLPLVRSRTSLPLFSPL